MKKTTRLPVMPDVTYLATLLGLVFTPPALICAAGFAVMAMIGESFSLESWPLMAGAAAWGGASLWSLRRCREQPWNWPVQAVLAAVGCVSGALLLYKTDDRLVFSLALMMFYPLLLFVLHLMWREPAARKIKGESR